MGNKKSLKILSVLVALMILVLSASGCSSDRGTVSVEPDKAAEQGADEGTPKDDEGPGWKKDTSDITFDWYIHYSWFGAKWGENEVTKYITEKTGVKINFIVPSGNENEKLNTLIASASLPDFVTLGWWENGVKMMQEGDLVHPLNKLADQYDADFYKAAAKSTLDWYKKPDGNVYGYPNFSMAPERIEEGMQIESNQTFLVRKDIYEQIGKPDMRTPEGFLNALKAAKEKFPTVNGQPLIPLGLQEFTDSGNKSIESDLVNFLAIPREKDGKYYDAETHPEYLRWMKVLRKANEMKLISKDIFVDKRSQMEEKMAQGRYFSMIYQRTDMASQQLELYRKNPDMVYIAIDGPSNESLEPNRPAFAGGMAGWTLTHISTNCKDSKRAIRFLTYLISEEGQKDVYLGKKGVTWDTIDGKDQMLPDVIKLMNSDRGEYDRKYGAEKTYWMLTDELAILKWKPPFEEPIKQNAEWGFGKAISYAAYDDIEPPADSDEGIILKQVKDKRALLLPKLILANSEEEFDKLVNEYQKMKNDIKYDKVISYSQQKIDEHKEALGIK
ncbi:carbohydrate ABC transporter substrate-binding protein (CUT1 family) [Anaerobacterium chartisolvens]|uniref:Carbohydrate ABC transporter substrate-binding protein (CUT1 family) n=1 Tax=Anaerobacterium chartisolvens TaxID=1297424 RepID=A0A369AHC2_9FIRM|nr:extracellular solute-binding protein [Anaerobacterium chartisolvens]RCX08495.1 carbohydrate ABC transporter substrate-binding protein (CUT1 family) [Anaerobacterium chartisolvens]